MWNNNNNKPYRIGLDRDEDGIIPFSRAAARRVSFKDKSVDTGALSYVFVRNDYTLEIAAFED